MAEITYAVRGHNLAAPPRHRNCTTTSYQQAKVNNYDNKYFSKYMPDFAWIAYDI